MKKEIGDKPTIGTQRTLKAVEDAFFALLAEKPLEDIRVGEICEKAMIPRTTFYNYFYDKYDVLQFLMENLKKQVFPEINEKKDQRQNALEATNKLILFARENSESIQKILKKNDRNSAFYQHVTNGFVEAAQEAVSNCTGSNHKGLPNTVVSRMNAYAIISLLEWSLFEGKDASLEELHRYLGQLLIT